MLTLADITWTQLGEAAIAIGTLGAFVVALSLAGRKTAVKIDQDPTPEFRKASKRYNHDATEQRFVHVEAIVARHESDIDRLKDLFRVDLPAMERRLDDASEGRISEVHDRVNEILGEVRELRGEMKGKK